MFFNGFDIFFRTLFQIFDIEGKIQWILGFCFILDGFLFLFYLNWKNNISYIKRTNGISLQCFYFAIIWNLDSSPNSFWYNLRFGFTQCQFYLNSSKMLISDSTMYRLLGSFDQKVLSDYDKHIPAQKLPYLDHIVLIKVRPRCFFLTLSLRQQP